MKALYQSTWCKFVLLLMLAAFVAAGAAVPVWADNIDPTTTYNYCYELDDTGIIILSEYPMIFGESTSGNKIIGSEYPFTLLTPLGISYNDNIQYQKFDVDYSGIWFELYYDLSLGMYNYRYDRNDTIIPQLSPMNYMLNPQSTMRYIRFDQNGTIYNMIQVLNNIEYVYMASNEDNYYLTNNSYPISTYQLVYNSTLDNWFNFFDSSDNVTKIINAVNNTTTSIQGFEQYFQSINQNQEDIEQLLYQIITYGSNYNQIDQTTINNLGTAQDYLNSAEGALQDKSKSLREGVSSQWQRNINTTKNFVSTITPATSAITTTITQIVAVMPEEVQALLVVIPLLLFIGWLIGRIGGG